MYINFVQPTLSTSVSVTTDIYKTLPLLFVALSSCVYVESCCGFSSCRKSKPQIFFGTRTHKQITQITHEMAKTAYSETP